MVTDSSYCKKRASFVELDRLKFKDRDRLDDQFVFWRSAKDKFMVVHPEICVKKTVLGEPAMGYQTETVHGLEI